MTITVSNAGQVSITANGLDANGNSNSPSFSPDGRYFVFTSDASNLVAGDTNGYADVFIKDIYDGGTVTRISTSAAGAQGNFIALPGFFSPDGSQVLFSTFASNVIAGDTNGSEDIFLKDLATGAITNVAPGVGNTIANSYSSAAVFSGDGSKIAFASLASNLGPTDTNGTTDIYIRDVATGTIARVSTGIGGEPDSFSDRPSINFDGTLVAFSGEATNLVSGDTNGVADVFVKNLVTGVTTRVSTSADGIEGNQESGGAILSPDGTHIAFFSVADNLVAGDTNGRVDIFLKNLTTGAISRVSETAGGVGGNGDSFGAVFSPDGHTIAFVSLANNFGATDTNNTQDIYIKDLVTGKLTLASHNYAGVAGDSYSISPSFSPDGTQIIYHSAANLTNHANGIDDIFIATVKGNPFIITGKSSSETINGSAENDVIDGRGGKDKIFAGDGNDTVWGGDEKSQLHGGDGNDILHGRDGTDRIYGDDGNDFITGGGGNDLLSGGVGNDNVSGNAGDDTIYGNAGDDKLSGNDGNDTLYGASGNDTLDGGANNDTLYGASGTDTLYGGTGNDTLYGEQASDILMGGDGNDTLYGGTGTNQLTGGTGGDSFMLTADAFDGHADKIRDFSSADDALVLDHILSGFTEGVSDIDDFVNATVSSGGTVIAIDRDGAGGAYGFENVALLLHVTGINVQNLYDSDGIIVQTA